MCLCAHTCAEEAEFIAGLRSETNCLIMFVLGESVCDSAEWGGHVEALTLLV